MSQANKLLNDAQRTMLFTTNVRFNPSTQTLKQSAIEKIVEQILVDATSGLDITQIQKQIHSSSLGFTITKADLETALKAIAIEQREVIGDVVALTIYRLSPTKCKEVQIAQNHAEENILKILSRLFETSTFSPETYKEAFLYGLGLIFYQLGSKNAHLAIGMEQDIDYPFLPDIISTVAIKFPDLDQIAIARILEEFIKSEDPLFSEIKWNMAQNYYVAVSLGLDASGVNLSRKMFENSRLYLDTNIAMAALEPIHPHYTGFQALFRACNDLNIDLRITTISLDELRRWFEYQHSLLDSGVLEQISATVGHQIDSLIYRIYASKKHESEEITGNEILLQNFENPQRDLYNTYDIYIEDDPWFDNARNLPNVRRLSLRIQRDSSLSSSRTKEEVTALHDAMLLYWIHKQRKLNSEQHINLLTADLNLPTSVPEAARDKSLTITFDAMLQWLSPIVTEAEQVDFKDVFAELIKAKILPQDRFFKIEDFRIFAQLDMDCKSLPDPDVLGCVSYIRENAPYLNPTKAEDREKLAHYVQRFFTDPGREYKKEIERYKGALGKVEGEKEILKKGFDEEKKQIINQHASQIDEKDRVIEDLKREKQKKQDEAERARETIQSINKFARVGVSFICLVIILLLLTLAFGEGENLLLKINSIDTFISGSVIVYFAMVSIYITRLDLILLGFFTQNKNGD